MFKQEEAIPHRRVLIASEDAEARRHMGELVRVAQWRAVGFIREADQVEQRTLLSQPDILLMDAEIYRSFLALGKRVVDVRKMSATKVLLCGRNLGSQLVAQGLRDEMTGTLDLATQAAGSLDTLAQLLRQTLGSGDAPATVKRPVPSSPVAVLGATPRKIPVPESVVIGSSTGGPMALMILLKALPANFPLPVAVVQHMPPGFTRMLAERLHAECAVRVVEAEAGMHFEPGTVYIAPGGNHMLLSGSTKSPRIELNTQNPENSCRPAVDVLFRSSASVYRGRQHVIVLTGMGRDGLAGATQLHALGSRIVVQDAATSTVWGMPGAIAQAGLADDILPIDQIAPQLMRCL